jgi:hypothetical protein
MKTLPHIYRACLLLLPILSVSCATLSMKGALIDTKEKAIQLCVDRGISDSRYALPRDAKVETYGPSKTTWSFGWPGHEEGFNEIGNRMWQVVYVQQNPHSWLTVIWVNAENGNLRIMQPEYPDHGLMLTQSKSASAKGR